MARTGDQKYATDGELDDAPLTDDERSAILYRVYDRGLRKIDAGDRDPSYLKASGETLQQIMHKVEKIQGLILSQSELGKISGVNSKLEDSSKVRLIELRLPFEVRDVTGETVAES